MAPRRRRPDHAEDDGIDPEPKTILIETIPELQKTIAFLNPNGLLTFQPPSGASEQQVSLAFQIAALDKQALRELGVGTDAWKAVIHQLVDAIGQGVMGGQLAYGEERVREAKNLLSYYHRLPVRNRLLYLSGTLGGVCLAAVLGFIVGALLSPIMQEMQGPGNLVLAICTFAAFGNFASVLTRLTDTPSLEREDWRAAVLIAGASRPLIGAFLAIAVFMVLQSGIVTIVAGGVDSSKSPAIALIAAFMCGFSERFGPDLLKMVSIGKASKMAR